MYRMSPDQPLDAPLRRRALRAFQEARRFVIRLWLYIGISLASFIAIVIMWSSSLRALIFRASTWWANHIPTKWAATAALVAILLCGATLALRIVLRRAKRRSLNAEVSRLQRTENDRRSIGPLEQELEKRVAEDKRKRIESRGVTLSIIVVLMAGACAGAFVYATTPEISDRPPSRSAQSIQSAALVSALSGGAVTIWLSNRRRRHDEATLEQGREELGLNRQRAEEERFTAAIELLGHEDSSVRVGALHVLHGLATTAPPRRQTVVDVMSAYLRLPFSHYSWDPTRGTPYPIEASADDREREVRRTALRLIVELVSRRHARSTTILLVDLTGANLDELDLQQAVLKLQAPGARFHGEVNLRDAFIHAANLRESTFFGSVDASDAVFIGPADFTECHFHKRGTFNSSRFVQPVLLARAVFIDRAFFQDAVFSSTLDASRAVFEQYASFGDSTFGGHADFEKSEFRSKVRFAGVTFEHTPNFTESTFSDDASFAGSTFESGARFTSSSFSAIANFRGITILPNRRQSGVSFYRSSFVRGIRLDDDNRPLVYLDDATFDDESHRPKGADRRRGEGDIHFL